MTQLLSMGECMIEFFSEEPLDSSTEFRRAFGGDTLNALVAARRLGTHAGFITRIAEDPFGRFLLNGWEREGIDTRHVRRAGTFNGVYFIATREDGEREFTYYRKGSAASTLEPMDLEEIDFGFVAAFHTSGITQALSKSARAAAMEGLMRASEAGCLTSFDLNFRPRLWKPDDAKKALEEAIPYVGVCFAGTPEDTLPLLGLEDPVEAAAYFHDYGIPLAVLKAGAQGAWVSHEGHMTHVPARIFGPAVDTTGAGDAFAGGFLHGLLNGASPEEAGRIGAACAGLKVQGRGAVASMPTGEAVRQALESTG